MKPTHWKVHCTAPDPANPPKVSYRYQVSPAFRPTLDHGVPSEKLFSRESTAKWHASRLTGQGFVATVTPYVLMPFTVEDAVEAGLDVEPEDLWPVTVKSYTEDWYGAG